MPLLSTDCLDCLKRPRGRPAAAGSHWNVTILVASEKYTKYPMSRPHALNLFRSISGELPTIGMPPNGRLAGSAERIREGTVKLRTAARSVQTKAGPRPD